MNSRMWAILIWAATAFFLSLGGNWAAVKEFPGWWMTSGWLIVAIAQAFVAARAFVEKPPTEV